VNGPIIVGGTAALAAALLVAGARSLATGQAADAPPPVGHYVIIDGVAASSVTVTIAQDGSARQYADVVLPATYQVTPATQVVAVSVIAGERADSISCLIERADGRTVVRRTGGGAYTSVLCAADLTE
jgi:hypothetical protein